MKKRFRIARRLLTISLLLVVTLLVAVYLYMQKAQFGKAPAGERLVRIQQSSHYQHGKFKNGIETPTMAEGHSLLGELWKQIFNHYPRRFPTDPIPSVKTDLRHLSPDANLLVWFGHSSCFIQVNGKTILIDPIFSGNASPIPGTVKPFPGTTGYSVADLPVIDYLLISHDHYDHLDYETVVALQEKTKKVVCGLGVGAHFERWGYPVEKIIEKDWHEKVALDSALTIHTLPPRHQSGRGFQQNQTLWMSYLIQTPAMKIFYSGDGGYDDHFAAIGKAYGPIDLAILENGQYDSAWHYVHCLPAEVLKAAQDLKTKRLLPVHSSKFMLARHPWDEPLVRISELCQAAQMPLITPRIGEPVHLDDSTQVFTQWWKGIR